MTTYRRTELALSLFVALLGAATVIGAHYTIAELAVLKDVVGARGFAYVVGSLICLGGLVLFAMQMRAAARAGGASAASGAEELGGDDPRFPASAARAFGLFAGLVAYAAILNPVGYIPATALFLGAGIGIMGGRGPARLVVYPLGYALVTWLLFDTVLGVRIPDGILQPLVRAVGL